MSPLITILAFLGVLAGMLVLALCIMLVWSMRPWRQPCEVCDGRVTDVAQASSALCRRHLALYRRYQLGG